ncbi:hypothetical protein, partial [Paenibacillus whitsoniae]|uniref:hypothetical protein n=1 Tax=Paenibacillus whitsoniae TaxID=2496558 RepID=UPI0019D124A0
MGSRAERTRTGGTATSRTRAACLGSAGSGAERTRAGGTATSRSRGGMLGHARVQEPNALALAVRR